MSVSKGLEAAIAKLAKATVEKGLDPAKVIKGLIDMAEAINNLTPEQRAQLREELREVRSVDLDT
jgi:hypothetical protein